MVLYLVCFFHSAERSAKKFASNSIFARNFSKNLQKFACFVTFGCKWACLIMETMKNRKFYSYWLILLKILGHLSFRVENETKVKMNKAKNSLLCDVIPQFLMNVESCKNIEQLKNSARNLIDGIVRLVFPENTFVMSKII